METKKIVLVGLLIIVSLLIAGCSTGLSSSKLTAPKIELSTTNYNMGDIDPSKGKWTETFVIKNTGDSVLSIVSVSTSCGCTSAEIKSQEIPPGEQTDLTITYDPSVHPGLTGPIKRVVYIQSNDPFQKEVEIELTGNVLPEVDKQ